MGFFDKFVNSVKETVEQAAGNSAQPETPAAPAEPREMMLKFGTRAPVPYNGEFYGTMLTVQLKAAGNAKVCTVDANKVSCHGGLEALKDTLTADIVSALTEALSNCSAMQIRVNLLPAHASEMSVFVQNKLNPEWKEQYGVSLDELVIMAIMLTEESRQAVNQLKNEIAADK